MTTIILERAPLPPFIANPSPSHNRSRSPLNEALGSLDLVSFYNDRLKHVLIKLIALERDFQNKVCLQRKLTGLFDLKEEIYGFSILLDKLIDFYTFDTSEFFVEQNLPNFEHLKELKEKICFLKKHFRLNELNYLFVDLKKDLIPSDGHILATVLGLNSELRDLIDNSVSTKRKGYFCDIVNIVRAKYQTLEYDPNDKGIPGLCKKLTLLGFTEERSQAIVKNISEDVVDLQTSLYWAERYLEKEFIYHPLLSDISKYPYSEQIIDSLFQAEILTTNRIEPDNDISSVNINMFNCNKKKQGITNLIEDFLQKVKDEDENSKLFYHGTTHEHAQSILTDGINLQEGEERNDFSHKDGFYLYEEFDYAKTWASRKGSRYAVLVFKVKRDFVNADLQNGLDVTHDINEWRIILDLCHNGYREKKVAKQKFKDIKFIRGQTSSWGKDKGISGHGRDKIQFCIRDEQYSEEFGSLRNICCVIFYA